MELEPTFFHWYLRGGVPSAITVSTIVSPSSATVFSDIAVILPGLFSTYQSSILYLKFCAFDKDAITKNKHIAVQDVLGSHFYRRKIQAYYQGVDCNYDNAFYKNSLPNPLPEYEYIILSAYVSQYGLKDYEKCLEQLNHSNKFIKLGNYRLIDVYQRIRS